MNEKLIRLINGKKEALLCLNNFSYTRAKEEYTNKLISLLKNKNIKLSIINMDGLDSDKQSIELSKFSDNALVVSDSDEIIKRANEKGLSVIRLSNDENSTIEREAVLPDMRSLFNVFNWVLNSKIGNLDKEQKPLRKVTAIIPAAGKGTRLGFDRPKALYPFLGKTALEIIYEKVNEISDRIIVISSQEGEKEIKDFIKSKGLAAEVIVDPNPYGSAGSVSYALDEIKNSEDVLVLWVDQIGISKKALEDITYLHQKNNADLSIPTRMRNKPYIHLERDENGVIRKILRKRFNDTMPSVGENETGAFIIKGNLLYETLNRMKADYWLKAENVKKNNEKIEEFDFLEIIPGMANMKYKILTAPTVLEETKLGFNNIEEVKYHEERIKKESEKKGVVFLDRDGVINEDVGYVKEINQIKILKDVPLALKTLKDKGLKMFAITNQAVIARGLASENDIENLHKQINDMIEKESGARIDKFYLCPHHPNASVEKYRKICECRKPAPGLILRAAAENNIDLAESWMIGDRITDIAAGKSAGCKAILIKCHHSYETNVSGTGFDSNTKPDYEVDSILEATDIISRGL